MTDGVVAPIEAKLAELSARADVLAAERDEYRKLYLQRWRRAASSSSG